MHILGINEVAELDQPATKGELLLLAAATVIASLFFSCWQFKCASVTSTVVMIAVVATQCTVSWLLSPYGKTNDAESGSGGGVGFDPGAPSPPPPVPEWDWQMGVTQWIVFVMVGLCNVAGTVAAVPAVGAFVKRLLDPSLQPWSDSELDDDLPVPSLTVLLPCYMPNEQTIVESTIEHVLTQLHYPRGYSLICCYNTPRPLEIETRLADLDGESYVGADGYLNSLRILKVEGSTSKAHNLNAALSLVDTEHVVIYDADHHPDPKSLSIMTSYMRAHKCACVQGSTYLRSIPNLMALLINAEFFITHFIVFPAQQAVTQTGFFGGSNALWDSASLKRQAFRHDVQTEDIEYSARVLLRGSGKIRFCPEARSGELPPASLSALWKQRLRWAIGWDQVTLEHWKAIRKSRRLGPCRKLSLYWIFPSRWLLLTLSLFAVFGIPTLALVDGYRRAFSGGHWEPLSGPPSVLRPFLATQTQLLVQYQWVCFCTLAVITALTALLYEWRTPHRILCIALFLLVGQVYLLINLILCVTSIFRICRGTDRGWVVTARSGMPSETADTSSANTATSNPAMTSSAANSHMPGASFRSSYGHDGRSLRSSRPPHAGVFGSDFAGVDADEAHFDSPRRAPTNARNDTFQEPLLVDKSASARIAEGAADANGSRAAPTQHERLPTQ